MGRAAGLAPASPDEEATRDRLPAPQALVFPPVPAAHKQAAAERADDVHDSKDAKKRKQQEERKDSKSKRRAEEGQILWRAQDEEDLYDHVDDDQMGKTRPGRACHSTYRNPQGLLPPNKANTLKRLFQNTSSS